MEPSLRTFPPPGILVVVILDVLVGILSVGMLMGLMVQARRFGGFDTVIGLTVGGCCIASGLGLLKGLPWARSTQMILNSLGIVLGLFLTSWVEEVGAVDPGVGLLLIVTVLPNVVAILLLRTPESREWFQGFKQRERERLMDRRRSRTTRPRRPRT